MEDFVIASTSAPLCHLRRLLLIPGTMRVSTILLLLIPVTLSAQGNVLFVIGSDTGIWDGLDVSKYHCTIGPTLYTDPTQNATRVMDPAFRGAMVDYFGTPMKLTWWLMAGNMFRLSANTDVPTTSTMPVYLMKRFEGDGVRRWGDELTFHYHDWYWSDENGDGISYWNQAPAFHVFAAEFDQTLAELLIEEDLFPVSFRSGWHAMDNAWQRRLDEILPFSMHNDYPSVHTDPTEPVDNVYDWSRAPSSHIPFHPSTTDYQVPGDCRGWNVRSQYLSAADSSYMAGIFAAAQTGVDQVVCLWAHLPETDFTDNLQKVNRSAHAASGRYPTVPFRYCTAVEAMQRWRRTADTTRPAITLTEQTRGDSTGWIVAVNEPIFQPAPVVVIKDRYEDHRLLHMTRLAPLQWQTDQFVLRTDLAEVAVAVTDTSGNLATSHQRYLPKDIFVDNGDAGYQEDSGIWSTVPLKGWGASYRSTTVSATDSAAARWSATVPSRGTYSIFLRIPSVINFSSTIHVTGTNGSAFIDSLFDASSIAGDQWMHVKSTVLDPGSPVVIDMTSRTTGIQTLAADVMRITALVREKWVISPERFDAGDFIAGVEQAIQVAVQNAGTSPAAILSARTASGIGVISGTFPRPIPPMGSVKLELTLQPENTGALLDTLILTTDDARHPELRTLVSGRVREYYVIVDDRDSTGYTETGAWSFSVAEAYGATSRYSYPLTGSTATFTAQLRKRGKYEISEIVPTTVNASNRARYVLVIPGVRTDSVFIDQNQGSGSWVHLLTADVPAESRVRVTISDAMSPIVPNLVLRADALQCQWIGEMGSTSVSPRPLPQTTALMQNYPNPFNPTTKIQFSITVRQWTIVRLFDVLGREAATLVNEVKEPGTYTAEFDGRNMASGVYVCTLTAGSIVQSRKMILVR